MNAEQVKFVSIKAAEAKLRREGKFDVIEKMLHQRIEATKRKQMLKYRVLSGNLPQKLLAASRIELIKCINTNRKVLCPLNQIPISLIFLLSRTLESKGFSKNCRGVRRVRVLDIKDELVKAKRLRLDFERLRTVEKYLP